MQTQYETYLDTKVDLICEIHEISCTEDAFLRKKLPSLEQKLQWIEKKLDIYGKDVVGICPTEIMFVLSISFDRALSIYDELNLRAIECGLINYQLFREIMLSSIPDIDIWKLEKYGVVNAVTLDR